MLLVRYALIYTVKVQKSISDAGEKIPKTKNKFQTDKKIKRPMAKS